jgi:hypothetical protein
MTRTTYYKGLQTSLQGPHFNNPDGALFLPGTEHRSRLHVASSFGEGIHFTSNKRVASRWAPIVAQVKVLGSTFLIPEKVAPRYRSDIPHSLAMGKYNKYRTDHLQVQGFVGIAAYDVPSAARGGHLPDEVIQRYPWSGGSYLAAERLLGQLNITLRTKDAGMVYRLTGKRLEALRSDSFCLWEVERVEVPVGPRIVEATIILRSSAVDDQPLIDALYAAAGKVPGVHPGSQRVDLTDGVRV